MGLVKKVIKCKKSVSQAVVKIFPSFYIYVATMNVCTVDYSRHADDLETGDILLLLVLINYLYPLPTEPPSSASPTGETSSSGSDQFFDSFSEQPSGDAGNHKQEPNTGRFHVTHP